jgi:hypothetical protein
MFINNKTNKILIETSDENFLMAENGKLFKYDPNLHTYLTDNENKFSDKQKIYISQEEKKFFNEKNKEKDLFEKNQKIEAINKKIIKEISGDLTELTDLMINVLKKLK